MYIFVGKIVNFLLCICMSIQSDNFVPINKRVRRACPPSAQPTTPGTLLIPEKYLEQLEHRMNQLNMKSFSVYLRFLLYQYQRAVFDNDFPKSSKIKTEYQGVGKNLLKIAIRATNNDWMLLSEISLGLGFSRCFVVVMLLEMDLGIKQKIERVLTTRYNRDGKIIPFAVVITQIIYPTGDWYEKKLRIYELSRLRDPLVRAYPDHYNKDGSFNLNRKK